MLKRFGVAALALTCLLGPAIAQQGGAPTKDGGPGAAMAKRREALLAQCPPPPSVPEADATTLPIHVTTWGSAGPAVLIVHGGVQGGLGGGPKTFARQEALTQKGWKVEVVDRPGFGQSPSRGVDDMERDSRWIADELGDGANLIGHSWGGGEALLAAARRPEAVRSLVLVEPALQSLLMGDPVMAQPGIRTDAGRFMGLLMAAGSPADYGLAFAQSLGASNSGGTGTNAAAAALKADPQRATGLGCALLQARMASPVALKQAAETLAKASVPVLVVTGGWSPFFDAVGDVAARLTGGRHIIVHSPNHFVQLSSADEFNTVVDAFMREADRTRSTVKPGSPHE